MKALSRLISLSVGILGLSALVLSCADVSVRSAEGLDSFASGLKNITVNSGALNLTTTETFAASKYNYTIKYPADASSGSSVTIVPVPNDTLASVVVTATLNGELHSNTLSPAPGQVGMFTINVTDPLGVSTSTYTVSVVCPPPEAVRLLSLTTNQKLSPAFNGSINAYTAAYPKGASTVTFSAVAGPGAACSWKYGAVTNDSQPAISIAATPQIVWCTVTKDSDSAVYQINIVADTKAVIVPVYNIGKSEMSNGTLNAQIGNVDVSQAKPGEAVYLSPAPLAAWSFKPDSITVTNASSAAVTVTIKTDKTGSYFTMPGYNVLLYCEFEEQTADVYAINIEPPPDGNLINAFIAGNIEVAEAEAQTHITLLAVPALGYRFDFWSVIKTSGYDPLTVANNAFTMPEEAVTVSANFVEKEPKSITIDQKTGGTVTVDTQSAREGEIVTISVTTDTAVYDFNTISISGAPGSAAPNLVCTVQGANPEFTFVMPDYAVKLTPAYTKIST
jgi:hypothetical protein